MPVIAQPAVPEIDKLPDANFQQARLVSAEELAQIRTKAFVPQVSEATVTELPETPVNQEVLTYQAAATENQTKAPTPVLAHVTSDTIVFEPAPGYRFYISGASADRQSPNVFHNLKPNTTYKCYMEIPDVSNSRSEPLLVTTKNRVPCTTTPLAPMVDDFTTTKISLVGVTGYEYRMADGEWQNSTVFSNLEPDTEYTFYQRIKETNTEFASAESEPLHCKTSHQGPSNITNMTSLLQFIDENGFVDEYGYKTLAYMITDEYGTEYYFLMINKGDEILFNVFSSSAEPNVLLFNNELPLHTYIGTEQGTFNTALYSEGVCVEYTDGFYHLFLKSYNMGDPLDSYLSSNYLTDEELSELCDLTTQMLLSFWDEFIYTALGFGIRGLGFVATEGYGDLFCNASVDVHFGEQIIVNQREAGCLSDGSKGDRYCTLCGYLYRNSIIQSSPRKHLYDNDCDVECNDCGHIRIVPHLYSYACDVHCDICGAVRAKPLSSHTFDANRICTKCGLEGHLIGDISGDGKVNMGDVSRVYAHTTGKTLLTDPYALAAADTNGDGKINLGDTSRILSHVRGTKLLW
jgi:ribosomal protein S27E